jgi:azurin
MQTRESRNITAALDLPPHSVAGMARQAAQMRAFTFAQLVAMAARIDRSRANAKAARIPSQDQMNADLDQIDVQLACMWALVEAELERRAPTPPRGR